MKATLKATQVDFLALAQSPPRVNLAAPTGPAPGPDSGEPAQEISDGRDSKIGVHCTSHHAFIAIVADANVIEREPRRLELPAMESSERLQVFVDDTAREFRGVGACGVALLKAEHAQGHVNVPALYGRAVLETLVRLAAVEAGLPVEFLDRRTARARLKLPMKGRLEDLVPTIFPGFAGIYWNAGRHLAAVAARALECG